MIIKNLFRILKSYKFTIITIIIFEIIYILRGYKGNKISSVGNANMADNIPCPYYFLYKIKKKIKNHKFYRFIDLGCGSGRVIDFFNNNYPKKKYVGVEYGLKEFEYSKSIFKRKKNIKILNKNFTQIKYNKMKIDCFFLNNPFVNDKKFVKFFNMLINNNNFNKKKIFIFVNFKKKTISNLQKIKIIDNYQITNIKGFSICLLNSK
jgi:SAM-dependent methyltransferase|tara:strand:- start:667 stop:1287 length:621 start_codon:yes stop_codon:yes gene_type:complete